MEPRIPRNKETLQYISLPWIKQRPSNETVKYTLTQDTRFFTIASGCNVMTHVNNRMLELWLQLKKYTTVRYRGNGRVVKGWRKWKEMGEDLHLQNCMMKQNKTKHNNKCFQIFFKRKPWIWIWECNWKYLIWEQLSYLWT